MKYSENQETRAKQLLSYCNRNNLLIILSSFIFFALSTYTIFKVCWDLIPFIDHYFFENEYLFHLIRVITALFTWIISICIISKSIEYIKNSNNYKNIFKKITQANDIRQIDIHQCSLCDAPTQEKIETYTTGNNNQMIGGVVNFGGKFGAKKIGGKIGEYAGTLIGSFIGIPELGAAAGEMVGKGIAGELYDDNIKGKVSSQFKDERKTHTIRYYVCPNGCTIAKDASSLENAIESEYNREEPLFTFSRSVILILSSPFLLLLFILALNFVIGLVVFIFYLFFSEVRFWCSDFHYYVGAAWSWIGYYWSQSWYITIPAIVILFLISSFATDGNDLRKDAKILEFGLNTKPNIDSKVSGAITLFSIIMIAICAALPFYHFNKTTKTPIKTDYQYVDLGLSVKWAKHNMGATDPSQIGDYLSWAECKPKSVYSNEQYGFRSHHSTMGSIFDNKKMASRHDPATREWGKGWRLPTSQEFYELHKNCNWRVEGNTIVGKSKINGNEVRFARTGIKYTESHIFSSDETGIRNLSEGCYWTSGRVPGVFSSDGEYFYLSLDKAGRGGEYGYGVFHTECAYGLAVRPVFDDK